MSGGSWRGIWGKGYNTCFPGDRGNFPRSMGILRKVLADAHKANRFDTKIMRF